MAWSMDGPQGHESDKVAHLVVPYLQGKCLDIGAGLRKVWPGLIGIDNGHHFGKGGADILGDGTDLSMFADGSMDGVFSSHCLEHLPKSKVPSVLREWLRVLKVGGHLVLYLPSANLYPKCGEPGANPDHKWDIYPGDIEKMLQDIWCWELRESQERDGPGEYSLFIVARKTEGGWTENLWQRNPEGKKRALVVRFGAVGDQIIASSILPGLRKQGYWITYCTTPAGHNIIKHDPHIDEWLIQETDYVPNSQLGPYFEALQERCDLFVNLCESVEGSLLTLPGRLTHGYTDAARRKLFGGVNYLARTHDIAGVPHDFAPKFYATEAELKWARAVKKAYNAPVITWSVHGSSNHKVYPFVQVVVSWLLARTPLHVVLLGDNKVGVDLQTGILDTLKDAGVDLCRVHPMAGIWDVRQALTFCQVADCVVGPETGPLNAVSFEAVPKVIYLSHSSHENLTRDWVNTTVLEPEKGSAPCFPCHRLHHGWEHCHMAPETKAALCASSIKPERIFEAIGLALGAVKKAA